MCAVGCFLTPLLFCSSSTVITAILVFPSTALADILLAGHLKWPWWKQLLSVVAVLFSIGFALTAAFQWRYSVNEAIDIVPIWGGALLSYCGVLYWFLLRLFDFIFIRNE